MFLTVLHKRTKTPCSCHDYAKVAFTMLGQEPITISQKATINGGFKNDVSLTESHQPVLYCSTKPREKQPLEQSW